MFVGATPSLVRDRVTDELDRVGWRVGRDVDPIQMVKSAGPARIVWYAPRLRASATFWARRASVVHGVPYVAVGSVEDYQKLQDAGAVVDEVQDFGGTFPFIEEESDSALSSGSPLIAATSVTSFADAARCQSEVQAMHRRIPGAHWVRL